MQHAMINTLLITLLSMLSCCSLAAQDDLFTAFANPPAEARPFVRWWWGENAVVEKEILREIDVMQQAGIAGFEINPISLPVKTELSSPSLQWLSPEFNRLVKVADDLNFVMGINHSVLHGYTYSPLEEGPYARVRYGAYFSEQNTWWPYFRKWALYNARLSAVFQASKPVVSMAILGPCH